jgi:hypothetical protein
MFDDQRWHLTEKIFRPIACGQPFILASTPGALEYLKSYGFKTFGDFIDESYDKIVDPISRLNKIIHTMKYIANLTTDKKSSLLKNLQEIADYNRKLFFSDDFTTKIVDEYLLNIAEGLSTLKLHKGKCLDQWNTLRELGVAEKLLSNNEYQELLKKI